MEKNLTNYPRNLLVGTWFGESVNEKQGLITELATIKSDGSFEIRFTYHDDNNKPASDVVEYGDWGLVGNIHFTITKSEFLENRHYQADLEDEDNYHAYKVLQLDSHIFQYQHVITQEVFNLRRVVDKIGHC